MCANLALADHNSFVGQYIRTIVYCAIRILRTTLSWKHAVYVAGNIIVNVRIPLQ